MDSPHFEQVIQKLIEQADSHQAVIMSIAQRLQEKGREEEVQQGVLQDIQQGSINIARTLLKNGVSVELVIESTGLSREELLFSQ
ncbi:hypothetical protein [Xenorhabdus bovienii]|uniref:hypothetical protein n=1 Tax=Xenorhabdus bovienii TaxID=40576 RepID=UPI003DA47776